MPKTAQSDALKAVGTVYAGTSGWAYSSWKPGFYPADLPARRFLEHYAQRLNSVEVNYTFRQTPSPATVASWLAQTGAGFRFSFKAPQRITHMRRLKDCGEAMRTFYSALMPVVEAGKMGLLLFQLPPNFKVDIARLKEFLEMVREVAGPARVAFEFRHDSWFVEEVFRVLRHGGAALCVAESDDLETPDVATAPFSCYRLRKSGYSRSSFHAAAERVMRSASRGDVFAYFKHEDTPEGALNAELLLKGSRKQ